MYRLEIENFYSFADAQEIDLRIPRNAPDYPERFAPIFPGSDIRVPKVVVLYGPNASGKSNVLRALSFLAFFLDRSFALRDRLPLVPFHDAESMARDVRLAVELGGSLDALESEEPSGQRPGTFRYEVLMASVGGAVSSVRGESLRFRPNGRGKWQRVFERGPDGSVRGSDSFRTGGFGPILDRLPKTASVVSSLSLMDHHAAIKIAAMSRRVVANILTDRHDPKDDDAFRFLAENPRVLQGLNRELNRIDVGIDKLSIEATPQGPIPLFQHRALHGTMNWTGQSHGTRSFIKVFPYLFQALDRGGIAVIDELDSAIHPALLPEILRWFYDPDRNPGNAQLWTTTHAVTLMDDLTKEQIVLTEKDAAGRSQVTELSRIGAVRRDETLSRKYLGGAYGAVPNVG